MKLDMGRILTFASKVLFILFFNARFIYYRRHTWEYTFARIMERWLDDTTSKSVLRRVFALKKWMTSCFETKTIACLDWFILCISAKIHDLCAMVWGGWSLWFWFKTATVFISVCGNVRPRSCHYKTRKIWPDLFAFSFMGCFLLASCCIQPDAWVRQAHWVRSLDDQKAC